VIERRLADHGLLVRRLDTALELEVETMRLTESDPTEGAGASYQGLSRVTPRVTRTTERRSVPAGSLWVPADQPDFEVAVQLFEPEAPDSLVAWGLLSIVGERKEYIDLRVLEPLVREMLDDPTIAAEWKRALADETFAADPGARWLYWYRRTPYWDETVGLLPVVRLLTAPTFSTSPWDGPG
jgi:hypothetical protein